MVSEWFKSGHGSPNEGKTGRQEEHLIVMILNERSLKPVHPCYCIMRVRLIMSASSLSSSPLSHPLHPLHNPVFESTSTESAFFLVDN